LSVVFSLQGKLKIIIYKYFKTNYYFLRIFAKINGNNTDYIDYLIKKLNQSKNEIIFIYMTEISLINFFSKLEKEVIFCINSIQYRNRPYEINILHDYIKKISVEHYKFFSCVEKYVININLTKYYVEELIFHLLLIQYLKKKN